MYESVCRLRVLDYQRYLPCISFSCAMRQGWCFATSISWSYLGNPQLSQGQTYSLFSKHTFNKDPKVRRKESLPRICSFYQGKLSYEAPGGLWFQAKNQPELKELRRRGKGTQYFTLFTFMRWRRKWQPTPVFLPGESEGRGSLVG